MAAAFSVIEQNYRYDLISPDKANRLNGLITGSTDTAVFADADFVIEAVFENLDVKKQVFAEVEAIVSETCVLATNTSSLSITALGTVPAGRMVPRTGARPGDLLYVSGSIGDAALGLQLRRDPVAAWAGAKVFRSHDVAATRKTLDVLSAVSR